MMNLLWRISVIFQWKTESEETPQEKPADNSNLKSLRGIVTYLCTDYAWINESIFFNTDMLCGNVPLNIGASVIALMEENETTHIQKAIKVKTVTNPVDGTEQSDLDRELCIKCVSSVTQDSIYIDKETSFPVHLFSGEFMPCKGDLLLVEYSMKPGTSNMNIHTMSHLSSQNSDEVCVTTIDGRTGVVEASMFFTLDSLHSHPGYTPALYDVVNVIVVDRIQSHYTHRVVSVIPVEMLSIPIIFNPF
ncbi:cancer/testis antigen 55-like [Peromyscus eremicus]|uniref:cancer/testis antigen 55-like n=1 Tax=Peromyscus eremicus TaxID=42410 RepID=UPI0027DDA15B|nr:cancer/testis antigen 55-like [Peromyscus eremicus]